MLTAKRYNSIHEIEPSLWNGILNDNDVFHTHDFISIVEDSKVENADFYYLLIYDRDQLVGTTVFSAFTVSLDLFISNSAFVQKIKKIFPKLFSIKVLACGLPASFGQLNLKIADKQYAAEISSIIADEMKALSKKLRISLLTVKEFRRDELALFRQFENEGFFSGYSIPYMNLDVHWKSFDEYLSSLRHHYRRRILLSLKKIKHNQPAILTSFQQLNGQPGLILTETSEDMATEFYKKYLAVMERTPTKLETLNLDFFKNLFRQKDYNGHEELLEISPGVEMTTHQRSNEICLRTRSGSKCKLLSLVVAEKIVSSAVLVFHGDTLTFMLVGKDEEKDEYDSYFNLVYGIISVAIQNGCKKIKMGQTAYWVKQCVGASPEDEFIYLASRKPFMHWILRSLRHVIFPQTKLKAANVFKRPAVTDPVQHASYQNI